MREMSVSEIQAVQLDILLDVSSFCDRNRIKYFLGCGTLCGAIVRQGFFPWDNDIDILMPRDDYERFIKNYSSSDLKLLSCKNRDYYYPYAKVVSSNTVAYECKNNIKDYGVFIDVFPIDGVPSKFYLYLLKPLKYLMMSKWGCYLDNRNIIVKFGYKIISLLTFPFPRNFFAKILNSICKKYSIYDYAKSGIVVHYRKNNEIVDSSVFSRRVRVIFEGNNFYGPKLYDNYLRSLYGDYNVDDDHDYNVHFRAYWK